LQEDSLLEEALTLLREVPEPPPERVAADRRRLMAYAEQLRRQRTAVPSLSQRMWVSLQRSFQNLVGMSPLLVRGVAFALALLFVFGGAIGTVAAANRSLPGDMLYPVKLLVEDLSLTVTLNSQDEAVLHLALANRRIEEVIALAERGTSPGPAVLERLQTHLQTSLKLAAGLPDSQMAPVLQKVEKTLAEQKTAVSLAMGEVPEPARGTLRQAEALVEQTHKLALVGLKDPKAFRAAVTKKHPLVIPTPVVPATPAASPAKPALHPEESPTPTPMPHHLTPTSTPLPIESPAPTPTPRPHPTKGGKPTHTPHPAGKKGPSHTPHPTKSPPPHPAGPPTSHPGGPPTSTPHPGGPPTPTPLPTEAPPTEPPATETPHSETATPEPTETPHSSH